MAGTLPGVEAARRRGFHRSHADNDGAAASRRPSFCLYATNNHEFQFSSHSSLERNPSTAALSDDEMLDAAVREAKKRLHQRLHCKSGSKRKVKGPDALGFAGGNLQKNWYKLISNCQSGLIHE